MTSEPLESNSSPPSDRFSSLPNELLDDIFEYAYPDFAPTGPLSKRLLPFFEKHFYRKAVFRSLLHFSEFASIISATPTKGQLVKFLTFAGLKGISRPPFEVQLCQALVLLPNLVELQLPWPVPLFNGTERSRLPGTYLSSLKYLSTTVTIAYNDYAAMSNRRPDLSRLGPLPSLKHLKVYGERDDYIEVHSHPNGVFPGITKLEIYEFGAEDPAIQILVNACPSLLHLEIECSAYNGPSFEHCLPHLPTCLLSLTLYTQQLSTLSTFDHLLPRFTQLRSLTLEYGCYTDGLVSHLLQLPLLVDLHLVSLFSPEISPDIPLDEFLVLLSGPSRLQYLKTFTFDVEAGHAGPKISAPSSFGSNIESELSRCKVDLSGWRSWWALPGEESETWFDAADAKAFIQIAKENGVVIRGTLNDALECVREYHIEANNRAILYTYVHRTLDHLRKARTDARRDGVLLPPLDLDSLDINRLELVEIDLPERDWFVLSLKNKE